MANERVRVWHSGGQIALTTTGVSLATATMQTTGYNLNLGGLTPARYPHVMLTLRVQFATATSIENKPIEVNLRRMNVQSTTDTEVPTGTFRPTWGAFVLKASSNNVDQFQAIDLFDIPQDVDVHLYNLSGQTMSTNWGLWAYPFTFGT
jgi:hypothetical protein